MAKAAVSKKKNANDGFEAGNVVWDLSELYSSADDPKIKKDINRGLKLSVDFKKNYAGKISGKNFDDATMLKAITEYEECMKIVNKASQYANLMFSLDTSDEKAKSLMAMIDEKCTEMDNNTLFFRLEICAAADKKIASFMKSKKLAGYRHFLETVLAFKPYQLSEKEEQIVNLKNLNGKNYVVKLYDELTSSFRFEMKMENGKVETLNGSQVRNLRYHQSPDIRKRSSEVYFGKYSENLLVISNLYNMILRDGAIENKLRGYKRGDAFMNVTNEISDKVVDTLVEVTTKNAGLVHRYYKLKAKLLKSKKLGLCDIYAPCAKSVKKFSWFEAKDIVLTSFEKFDTKFAEMAAEFFDKNWIDAKLGPNKRSGAYCSSSYPELHPYVFMNYTGNMRDVMTLAHELGHAIHALLSSRNTILNYHAILPLCETASIFSERIVSDALLNKLTDKNEKISLLTSSLEDFFATSFRQNMFTRFERAAHAGAADRIMPSGDLTEIYKKELKVMFGDSVDISDDYSVEWSVIPHIFHVPFYCYSYNFALLLVLALYQKYCEEGPKFKAGFIELLSSGSIDSPAALLKKLKIDINDKKFWQKGFDYMATRIDELEKVIKS